MKKVLITGSSGMIGTRLSEMLTINNIDHTLVDKKSNVWNKKVNNNTIILDLLKYKNFDSLPGGIESVVHLASNSRVYESLKNPQLAKENIELTFNVLEFCRVKNIKNLIFTSSREIYGDTINRVTEDTEVNITACQNPYGASKISSEILIQSYHKCFNIKFIIARLSNVYGMYDMSNRVVPSYFNLCMKNKELNIYSKDKILDFIYIDDVVDGILQCIYNFNNEKNSIINFVSGTSTTLLELATIMKNILNSNVNINYGDNRDGEVNKFFADNTKFIKFLNRNIKYDIKSGMQKTVEWYLSNYK